MINFCQSLKDPILEYFSKTYKYIEDLFVYKEIDLATTILDKNPNEIKEIVETMIKVTKVSLKTIGVPEAQIRENGKQLDEIPNKAGVDYISIEDYFGDIKIILNKFLLISIIDYLLDIDKNQLNTAELFDLLPKQFKEMIDAYKSLNIIDEDGKNEIKQNIGNLTNLIDLSNIQFKNIQQVDKSPQENLKPQSMENFVNELEEFQKDRRELISPTTPPPPPPPPPQEFTYERVVSSPKEKIFVFSDTKYEEKIKEPEISELKTITIGKKTDDDEPIEEIQLTEINAIAETFLGFYGKFPKIEINVIDSLNINSINLINSRVANPSEFLDLETLFYYIAILKMIGIGFPFSSIEIIEVAKNYINNQIFSSSKMDPPEPRTILFGIALFSELNLLNRKDIIDIQKIKDTLISELTNFIPEKLSFYFDSLLALNILERRGLQISDMSELLDRIIQQSLPNLVDYDPITDIYYQLASIKLFKNRGKIIPSDFKNVYLKELKNLIQDNNSINNLITDSAKMLLIIDLLDLKEKEKKTCNKLIKFITEKTVFFDSRTLNQDFNWKQHKLAYVVELRMLFWALLALSQYSNQI